MCIADFETKAQSDAEYEYRQELESSYIPASEKKKYAFFYASARGDADHVSQYIHQGVDINFKAGKNKKTALMVAAMNGHSDIVRMLWTLVQTSKL